MKTMMLFKKTILAALVAALTLAAFPLTAFAANPYDPPTPPAGTPDPIYERLENVWGRMLDGYERAGQLFDKSDDLSAKAETMIARLKENGESTAELEAALAAFEDAVKQAKPVYESCNGIVTAHKGFDDNGKATDAPQAILTMGELGSKLMEIREAMDGTGRALFELMKSIRDAHRPTPTPTPSSPGGGV